MTSNGAAVASLYGSVWLDANRYYEAERRYQELLIIEARRRANPTYVSSKPPVQEFHTVIMKSGPHKDSKNITLSKGDASVDIGSCGILARIDKIEKGHEAMKNQVAKLASDMTAVLSKLSTFEKFMKTINSQVYEEVQATVKNESKGNIQQNGSSVTDDDDLDLFGSDEEDASAVKLREERLQAYASKKAKKPALVAKSSVVLDVKPWDDETDMKEMEKAVRAIQSDGLVWGASKLVPLAYGINKLQIVAIVEDDKVSIDWLQETISDVDELVQSVDIAAFNKL